MTLMMTMTTMMMMMSMWGVTLRTDEWENLEPEIASKAKRSCIQVVLQLCNFATANEGDGDADADDAKIVATSILYPCWLLKVLQVTMSV